MFFSAQDLLRLDVAWRTKTRHNGYGYPGYIDSATANTEATLSPLGLGILEMPDDAGETLFISSTSASDTSFLIIVECLDDQGLQAAAWAITNGTANVELKLFDRSLVNPLTNTSILISRVLSVANRSQSRLMTTGDVLVKNGTGTTFDGFKAADGRSLSLKFTIPRGKVGYFLPSDSTLNKTGSASGCVLRTRSRIEGGPWLAQGVWGLQRDGSSAYGFLTADCPVIPPFTDIMVTAEAFSNDTWVSGRVSIALYDEEDLRM